MGMSEFDSPAFLARLRMGEQSAYRLLIRRFHVSLVGVASSIIGSRAQAEEVVQDTWLTVFSGISRFEGRSSLATWLFSIALNRARTRISRERRCVALPAALEGGPHSERAVDASAFTPGGQWKGTPSLWDELDPERIVGDRQLWEHVRKAIEVLPPSQRAVITLRDLEGRSPQEIRELLMISSENQRVLLHRARTRIRAVVDALVGNAAAAPAMPRRCARETAPRRVWRIPAGSIAQAG